MNDSQYIAPATDSRYDGPQTGSYHEPAIMRYLQLLWKHSRLILLASLLPAVLVALLLSLWPRKYTATFVYERPLTEREYTVLLRRFYSRENLDKIIRRLREQKLTDYARSLEKTRTEESFERLIRFEVAPMHPQRLVTTDPATSELISTFQARLLLVKVIGDSKEEVAGASAVVTGSIENVLPIYDIRNALKESVQQFRIRAAEIEDNRFTLQLDLEKEKAKLEKLQNLGGAPAEASEGNLVLQFTDVQGSRDFLPLSYQVRAVQSRIIDLQETLTSNAEKYDHYLQVLDLNDKLLEKLDAGLLTDYTTGQFLQFLGEQLLACKEEAVSDYLKSYLRKTENLIQVNRRASEKPVVYPIARHVARNSVLTLVLFLMVAAFGAVLLEYRQGRFGPSRGLQG
jgi:LPS O-antigen subunit length determinant protein (WzzB/FepE family)